MGKPIFVDRSAIVGWVFMGIFTLFLVLMTYVFLRDGGFRQFNPLAETGVMLLFWLCGLAGLGHFLAMPIVRIWIEGDTIVIRERWMMRGHSSRYALATLQPPSIEAILDSDGDTFKCVLTTPDDRKVIFSHHTERSEAETSLRKFNLAAGLEVPVPENH